MASVRETIRDRMKTAKPAGDSLPFIQCGARYVFEVERIKAFTAEDQRTWILPEFTVKEVHPTLTSDEIAKLPPGRKLNAVGSSCKAMWNQNEKWGPGLALAFLVALLGVESAEELFEVDPERNISPYDYILEKDGENAKGLLIACEAYLNYREGKDPSPRFKWMYLPPPAGHPLAGV